MKIRHVMNELLRAALVLAVAGASARAAGEGLAQGDRAGPALAEGAPLGNDNVRVHTVERKPYPAAGRHELALYPAVAQLNGAFTQHLGAAATYSYHLFETLSVQVSPVVNYLNRESSFNQELIDKGHQQAQAATALLLQYGAVAGLEMAPLYGKFALFDGVLAHFSLVINAGAGLGSTRVELRSAQIQGCDPAGCAPPSFGDTGLKFLGSIGAGFRVALGGWAALRLEVRDLVYTARVDRINGCTFQDLDLVQAGQAPLSASCRAATKAQGGPWAREDDRALAAGLLRATSSDVINNVSLYAGLSFLF
jgi:outer membrane beta-barrel protein